MSVTLNEDWKRLVQELPDVPDDAELILRGGKLGSTATIRYVGLAPRVFAHHRQGVTELVPALDDQLPGAHLMADSAALAEQLRPHVGRLLSWRLVSWRPGRRAVLRLVLADGTVRWLKLLDRKCYRRARRAFRLLGDSLSPLQMMNPDVLLPKVCGYLASPAPGRALREVRDGHGEVDWSILTRAVLAIGYTQLREDTVAPDSTCSLPLHDFGTARAAAVSMLGKGAAVRAELVDLAEDIAGLVGPAPLWRSVVHGDLHDKQLFVACRTVALIDLEGIGVGDFRFDIVNLVEHLRLRDLQRAQRDTGLADCILARCSLDADDPEVRVFRAVVRARLAGVYALRPRWRSLVTRLIGEVEGLVEEIS